ncbi:tetratricopeptide repeat protein 39B-like protein [Dinothrombium tinctorium]|uniref:Tetratricopeptide repeat protein 39B-like protein n=1 Tax=Dinothrombium tinctorium TaxID=1965070 RepID=A0A3S3R235_9ACAR|nr:tetratricopeptide repeat protein 39B-like protein [Dinothrombium tinctorium]RWS17303.1 tetratricopeptide repeat protein 39B-like protein [Dinothrombium tinctorium]
MDRTSIGDSQKKEIHFDSDIAEFEQNLREANQIFDLFYMNKFEEAYARCDEKLSRCLPHSHMKTFISFFYAVLTLEKIVSLLPKKIHKLLSIAGFSGDKDVALAMIKRATELRKGIRCRVSVMAIQGFCLYFEQLMGLCEIDEEWIENLVEEYRRKFPKAAFVLFFSAKFHLMNGEPDEAAKEFIECIKIQDSWKQIHRICSWDLVWSYALKNDWDGASKYAKILREESPYSPATNEYQLAVFKMMQMKREDKSDKNAEVAEMMKNVVSLKKRYAGRTLPQEKFVCTRATQYENEGRIPIVALLELYYIWNVLSMTSNKQNLIDPLLNRVNETLTKLGAQIRESKFDDLLVLWLMKGVLLRNRNDNEEALKCFHKIIDSENKVIRDTYIVPHAALELGITYMKLERIEEARKWLTKTKSGYEKFLNESVVSLRVAAALRRLKQIECCNN